MNSESTPDAPPELSSTYPAMRKEATFALQQELLDEIQTRGPISFHDFMERCLYHPEYGYYTLSQGLNIGKTGDFFTSVSVGQTFGIILCERLHSFWKEIDSPKNLAIYELGAHTGQLAADILSAAKDKDPFFFSALEYHISEPIAGLRAKQQEKLKEFTEIVMVHESPFPETKSSHNVFLSNELIDALPIHLITLREGTWLERFVDIHQNELTYIDQKLSNSNLIEFCQKFPPREYTEGYTTEVRLQMDSFIASCLPSNFKGLFLTIDYGLSQDEYYHRARSKGTLQGFSKHQTSEDFLKYPGSMDMTAHVDFTAFADAAEKLGFQTQDFTQQGRYLTKWAKKWLLNLEDISPLKRSQYVREFQTLTHPGQMGSSFKVLEMVR